MSKIFATFLMLLFSLIPFALSQEESSQPLWSMSNWATAKYSDKVLTRINKEGIQVFDLSNGDLLNTINVDDIGQFDIVNDVLLIRANTTESKTLTGIDFLTSEVKWQKSFDGYTGSEYPKFFLAKDLIIVDTIIDDSLQHELRAFDVATGNLVWTQFEKNLYYLNDVTVENDVILGTGGRHTSTMSMSYERDLYTGELIELVRCGLACSFNPSTVVFEDDETQLTVHYSTYALGSFSQYNFRTQERISCPFGANGYIHENGNAYTDADLDTHTIPFQVKIRTAKVVSNGKSIVLNTGEKLYQYPMCDAWHQNNLLESGGLVLTIEDSRINLLRLSERGFIFSLTDSKSFEIAELMFETVKMEYEHPEYKLTGQYPFSIKALIRFDSNTFYYKVKEDYIVSFRDGVLGFTDLMSGKSLARFQIDEKEISSGVEQKFLKYDVVGDYFILNTTGEISVFRKPAGFNY